MLYSPSFEKNINLKLNAIANRLFPDCCGSIAFDSPAPFTEQMLEYNPATDVWSVQKLGIRGEGLLSLFSLILGCTKSQIISAISKEMEAVK